MTICFSRCTTFFRNFTFICINIWNRIKELYKEATNYDVTDERYVSPFEGKYETEELAAMVEKEMILQQAIDLILENVI
jgi:hypothetical protein